jgi:hypothetical protein
LVTLNNILGIRLNSRVLLKCIIIFMEIGMRLAPNSR